MSLFGTSPEDNSSKSTSGLFGDDANAAKKAQAAGLFSDNSGPTDDSSPWGFQPTPKKNAHTNIVKTLLPASDVPESYIDTFESLAEGDTVRFEEIRKLLHGSGLSTGEQQRILDITEPKGTAAGENWGRGEFNVLLALIGLAQEGEEVSLDSVDDRKRRLPEPRLPKISKPRPETPQPKRPESASKAQTSPVAPSPKTSGGTQQRNKRTTSYSISEDPWASPAHTVKTNGHTDGMSSNMGARTTSTFTTAGNDGSDGGGAQATPQASTGGSTNDWGYSSTSASTFGGEDLEGSAFGYSGGAGESQPSIRPSKPPTSGRQIGQGAQEEVVVTALPEKQGTLLFQYRNYEVATIRKNSKVVRRYSDFVWLLDCLHKKYPFRQLPLLPPKRVSINGNHIAADTLFIERRRRGLQRFANALVRHPVLSQEQLVVMFLTVPTELAVWRKQANTTVQEEFTGKPLPSGLEDSLPPNLDELLDTVRSGVRRSAEAYIHICNSLERIFKRQEGLAGECSRFSSLLAQSTEYSADTYKMDINDVPLLNEGVNATSKHFGTYEGLLLDESRSCDEGALEDFKRQRDALVSMRDMFDRRDRYAKDTIPQCERRISANEAKLSAVRAKPEGTRKVGEAEKLEDAITKDKESIVAQHARGVFIKECVRDEIQIWQGTQYFISRMHQDWSSERTKYAEQQVDCWRELSEHLESMPTGGE